MPNQVVILAAGASSRFFPFNNEDKSLFFIAGRPIISHTLESIKKSGISKVVVVVATDQAEQIVRQFAPSDLELTFTRLSSPDGAGAALLTAKDHLEDSFFVINSEKLIFNEQISDFPKETPENFIGATLRIETPSPEKFGIYKLDGDRVIELVEKPARDQAPSNWKLVGVYLLTKKFVDILESTPTETYQLEEAIQKAADESGFYAFQTNEDVTLKYPWDLFEIKDQILNSASLNISDQAKIADTAIIRGNVTIESGATIGDFAIVEGPAYIGKNALVGTYSQVRAGSVLEEGAQAERYCDVRGSIISKDAHIHSEFVGDSIVGENVRIGGGFITANKRMDRTNIHVKVREDLVGSGRNNIGVFVGADSHIGVGVSTMPGTVIGPRSVVYPGITIKGTHPANSKITTSNL